MYFSSIDRWLINSNFLQTAAINVGGKHTSIKQSLPETWESYKKTDKYWTGVSTLGKFSSFIVFRLRAESVYTELSRKNSERKVFLAYSTREWNKRQQPLIEIGGGNWEKGRARAGNPNSACTFSPSCLVITETCMSDTDINNTTEDKLSEPRCAVQLIAGGAVCI